MLHLLTWLVFFFWFFLLFFSVFKISVNATECFSILELLSQVLKLAWKMSKVCKTATFCPIESHWNTIFLILHLFLTLTNSFRYVKVLFWSTLLQFFIFIVAHQVVLLFPIQSKQQNFAFSFFLQGCFATEINVVG